MSEDPEGGIPSWIVEVIARYRGNGRMLWSESQQRLELCQTLNVPLSNALYRSILEICCKSSQIQFVRMM